jgi:hypothetical protein
MALSGTAACAVRGRTYVAAMREVLRKAAAYVVGFPLILIVVAFMKLTGSQGGIYAVVPVWIALDFVLRALHLQAPAQQV